MNVSDKDLARLLENRKAVLLDMDGTLIDSNLAHARAWSDSLKSEGYDKSPEQLLPLIGMGADKILPIIIGEEHSTEKGRRLSGAATSLFRTRYLPHVHAFKGTRSLCETLASRFRIVIASSAESGLLKELIETAGIADLIAEETGAGDTSHSKPDADVLYAALGKAGCDNTEAFFIGDTPYDHDAALAAQIEFVGFRCGGWNDGAFRGAAMICDGPGQLAELLHGIGLQRSA